MRSPIRCFSCSLGRGEIACRQVSEKHGRCSRPLAMFGGRYETTIVSSANHGTTTPSRGNLGLDGVHGSPIKWLDAASLLLFLACCRHAHGYLPYPCMRGSPSSMPFCRLHAQRNQSSSWILRLFHPRHPHTHTHTHTQTAINLSVCAQHSLE